MLQSAKLYNALISCHYCVCRDSAYFPTQGKGEKKNASGNKKGHFFVPRQRLLQVTMLSNKGNVCHSAYTLQKNTPLQL